MSAKDDILKQSAAGGNTEGQSAVPVAQQPVVSTATQEPLATPLVTPVQLTQPVQPPTPPTQLAQPTAQPTDGSRHTTTTSTVTTTESGGGSVTPNSQQGEKKPLTYVEMFQKMNPYKPPTDEELEKERKKRKREQIFNAIGDGVQALANLYFTTQYAPNSYNPKNSLSAKAKERWDKADAERKANNDAYFKGWMQAQAADDANARDNRNWLHTIEREKVEDKRYADDIAHRDKREGIEDKRYDDNIAHRDKREGVEDERWNKNFEMQQRQFNESVRQFNVTSSQNAQRIRMESQRLGRELAKGGATFALGQGKGSIHVSAERLNSTNVAYVFNKLPANVRSQVHGEAIYDSKKKKIVGYKDPTSEAMLIAIGTNIESCPAAQDALREVAGQKTPKKKSPTGGGGGGKKSPTA